MKYNESNKPLVCMMTQSTCYKGTRRFTPKGILWHSTGANNPTLKRYVQPDDNARDRDEWLAKLGRNQYGNDWNHIDRQAGMNFWIGKLADGTVAAVQTMPWDYRPWGCGSGSRGTCNDTHIQFEICEDALTDAGYFNACYREACEMTAYLCRMFGIDPKGTISYNGLKIPTIIDHIGSHNLGLGSNHGDVQHWFKRYGKTLDNVRNDVAALLAEDGSEASTPAVESGLKKGDTGDAVKAMQTMLIACGYSCGPDGADGDFGRNTLAGLKAFQTASGLTVSGVYDEKTKAALEKAYNERRTTPAVTTEEEAAMDLSAVHAKYINSTGTHYISNSGSDERGQYRGGEAGDQTGTEWRMRSWYSRPWNVVLRYPDQKVALMIARLGIDAALNDMIGYDQGQNRTYLKQLKAVGWEPSRISVACEADCSAGVCANITAAGYLLGIDALKNHTGTYTGNMHGTLVRAGFKALTDSKYLTSGDYLLPGDILLYENHHTATNVTIGKKARGDWNPGTAAQPASPTTPATPTTPDTPTTPTATRYYRVRKSWADKASQIGAFTVFQNAKNCVDANPGYAAFDDNGVQVYPEARTGSFTRYSLTDTQLKKIARLCQQEQGSVAGAKAEASLMANQLETSRSRQNKYGTGAEGLYNWVRNGGWFSRAAHWMDNGSVSEAVLAGVKDVLVNGNRTLPLYVDEHDCLSDITSISTGSVKDRNAYIQGKTVVKNKYGSTWTFWCFPDKNADPFGYTAAAYKAAQNL